MMLLMLHFNNLVSKYEAMKQNNYHDKPSELTTHSCNSQVQLKNLLRLNLFLEALKQLNV